MALYEETAGEIADRVRSGDVSVREVTEELLGRIESVDDRVGAYITVSGETALERADELDERLSRGEDLGPLGGVPVAVKDNICTRGVRTTAASAMLSDYVPPYDATIVERLHEAGAVIVGKTNLDEFAMGGSTENSGLQKTTNPWDTDRVPGGSSGGSAAALAAREAHLAIGSDTGGSIRQPAALCGVVGLKPTYGRVSRYGLIAFASSLDQIGPMGRSVRDVALLLEAIAGKDPRDSTSVSESVPAYAGGLDAVSMEGLTLGVPTEFFDLCTDDETRKTVRRAIDFYREQGAEIVDISLPNTRYAIATYYLICTAEASSNLARYDGVHYGHRSDEADEIISLFSRSREEGFGDEVKRRIMLGTFVLSADYYDAYYLLASRARKILQRDFARVFESVDAILCPTSPVPAFRIGERLSDPLTMYAVDVFTAPVNLAGLPGISIPCGFTEAELPVGLQIIGRPFDESRLLSIAHRFETAHPDCFQATPPISGRETP